ncbi:methylenetetrahydrofolate reductase C-terminal domain-containing protein [Pseudomonas sp. CC6-YY-74]|uniref:methylenetetrahydrofolate reductase C-terminal domain-containing protein n=1 Tax=Pseudomonas sp. CC6-YY-74 TaxID=1930532 RepID=UPI0009A183D5|nr:methylenetetrahydrofolate reductase C-terminal domain-containing protein [Pseudomonas sp. CC6-YY-74]
MRSVRYWSVEHAGLMELVYNLFEKTMVRLNPLWKLIGYERIEKPFALVEKAVKGFLFDCKMCGQCMLSSNGMSCPMNCPKTLRNGPCGGVRANGNCEIDADMRCVFVEAAKGARKMQDGNLIQIVQLPVDHTQTGRSSWLRVTREMSEAKKRRAEGAPKSV